MTLVNSRKVMASILKAQGISDDQFAPVCVVVDKLDKIGDDAVTAELVGLGSIVITTIYHLLPLFITY